MLLGQLKLPVHPAPSPHLSRRPPPPSRAAPPPTPPSASRVQESGEIVGGIFDAQVLDGKGVEAVSKLPTKQELMGKTALLLKALPTKLARSLNEAGAVRIARGLEQARGQKMVRAVKAASEKLP